MATTRNHLVLLTAAVLTSAACPAHAGDPAYDAAYEHGLVRKGPPAPLDWTSGPGDVWRVSGLEFVRGGEMSVSFGESTLVLGVHDKNPVWAVILPDAPTSIVGRTAASGALVKSAWIRFHPAQFPELFPVTRVTGPGPAAAMLAARRIALHKMDGSWDVDGLPALPDPGTMVLDCDTVQGPRRFLKIDDTKHAVQYLEAYEKRTLPPDTALESSTAVLAFDAVWSRFDEAYAKFALRPDVDWDGLRGLYRPLAEGAKTTWEAGTAIALCLENLRDLQAGVRADGEDCPRYERLRELNASWSGTQEVIGDIDGAKSQIAVGRTKDNIAYIAAFGLTESGAVDAFDAALESVGDCWSLVLDLRMNEGGDEAIAQQMAARFYDKKRNYGASQSRSDPKQRTALSSPEAHTLEPRGPWRWVQPVAVLQGRRTKGAAESFVAMMTVLPLTTTMGDRTAGAGSESEKLDLGSEVGFELLVNVPTTNELDGSGKSFLDVGLAPKVAFAPKPTSFTSDSDALVTQALERLRKQSKGVRRSGKPSKQ